MRRLVLMMALATIIMSCSATEDASADLAGIAADPPVVDGSTSTHPLRTLVMCRVVDVPCDWRSTLDGTRRIVPSANPPPGVFGERVPSSGTHGSYVALLEGEADLIFTARQPNDDEIALAESRDLTFDVVPIALDAFVFLVNDANAVQELSLDDIRAIFSGKLTNWSQVGGDDEPIQPYQRNETSGSQVLMRTLVMRDVPMTDAPNLLLPSMTAPFDAISRDSNGIAYSVFYFATQMLPTDDIRLLRIDGIAPNIATIRSAAYPLVTEVYAVLTDATPEAGTARQLRDWMLTDQGRRVIAESSYIPLP